MRHYPAFLNLHGRRCLVVGAGEVGLRKVKTLASCHPAAITVIDTAPPSEAMIPLLDDPAVVYNQRPFSDDDITGCTLVFACTSNAELNAHVARLCNAAGTLCNIADAPAESGFIVPATFCRDSLVVAFSTGGASPAVCRRIRKELEDTLGPRYGGFITLMGRIRPLVLEQGMPTCDNTSLFRQLAYGPLLDAVGDGDSQRMQAILQDTLPKALHPHIGELIDGIV